MKPIPCCCNVPTMLSSPCQQALAADDQPSAPSTPEPADSTEALSHTVAQDAVRGAVEKVEDEGDDEAPAPPPPPPPPAESPAEVELAPPADVPLPTTVASSVANGPVPPPGAFVAQTKQGLIGNPALYPCSS